MRFLYLWATVATHHTEHCDFFLKADMDAYVNVGRACGREYGAVHLLHSFARGSRPSPVFGAREFPLPSLFILIYLHKILVGSCSGRAQ